MTFYPPVALLSPFHYSHAAFHTPEQPFHTFAAKMVVGLKKGC